MDEHDAIEQPEPCPRTLDPDSPCTCGRTYDVPRVGRVPYHEALPRSRW